MELCLKKKSTHFIVKTYCHLSLQQVVYFFSAGEGSCLHSVKNAASVKCRKMRHACILASFGCCNKCPKTGWLWNNRNVFCRSLGGQECAIRVCRTRLPLRALGRVRLPLAALVAAGILGCGCITPVSTFVFTRLLLFCLSLLFSL